MRPTEGSSTAGKEGGDETMSANEDVAERVEKKKEKTRGGKALRGLDADADQVGASGASVWTQKQQKALETALAQLPKGSLGSSFFFPFASTKIIFKTATSNSKPYTPEANIPWLPVAQLSLLSS